MITSSKQCNKDIVPWSAEEFTEAAEENINIKPEESKDTEELRHKEEDKKVVIGLGRMLEELTPSAREKEKERVDSKELVITAESMDTHRVIARSRKLRVPGRVEEKPRVSQKEKERVEASKERAARVGSTAILGTIAQKEPARARVSPIGRVKEAGEEKAKGLVWPTTGRQILGTREE